MSRLASQRTSTDRYAPFAAVAFALAALFASANGHAQPTPEHSFTPKVSLYSEYEYRGIGQSSEKPALQLNLDYSHKSGFYLGAFLTNIKWIGDTKTAVRQLVPANIAVSGGGGSTELDLFGGYKAELTKDLTIDVGYLHYEYPGADAIVVGPSAAIGTILKKPNTDEVYLGLSGGPFNVKYSYSTGDAFGIVDSKGSSFIELNWSQELAKGLTANAQVGRASFKNNSGLTYTVYKLGGTYDFGDGWNLGAYYKTTNAIESNYTFLGKDWSKGRLVVFASKSF